MMQLPDRKKVWWYVHSFRHNTCIGQTDRDRQTDRRMVGRTDGRICHNIALSTGWSRDATARWLAAGSCGNRWRMGTGWACPRRRRV